MNEDPAFLVLMLVIGAYVFNLWLQDYAASRTSRPTLNPLPGATGAPLKISIIAALGALIIVGLETWGELRLGISDQQSKITFLFGVYTLVAAFIEELIFRGFIVIENRGKALRRLGILGASLVFAAIHPFLWTWEMGDVPLWNVVKIWQWNEWFTWQLTPKGWFSTGAVFASSLWFYAMRFNRFNPLHSLIPCIVAHGTKNLGVIVIKAVQGHVSGWW